MQATNNQSFWLWGGLYPAVDVLRLIMLMLNGWNRDDLYFFNYNPKFMKANCWQHKRLAICPQTHPLSKFISLTFQQANEIRHIFYTPANKGPLFRVSFPYLIIPRQESKLNIGPMSLEIKIACNFSIGLWNKSVDLDVLEGGRTSGFQIYLKLRTYLCSPLWGVTQFISKLPSSPLKYCCFVFLLSLCTFQDNVKLR